MKQASFALVGKIIPFDGTKLSIFLHNKCPIPQKWTKWTKIWTKWTKKWTKMD